MIATCPACSTRYVLDPLRLGRGGRTVRCAKCRHAWHLEPPEGLIEQAEEVDRLLNAEREPAPQPAPAPETPADDEPAPVRRRPLSAGARPGGGNNLPAVRKQGGRAMLFGWLALAGSVVVLLGILIGLKGPISQSIPAMAGVYEAVGLGERKRSPVAERPKSATELLAFTGLGLSLENEGGVPVLNVTGQITNSTEQSFEIPTIEAELLDAEKLRLFSWTFEPPEPTIGPGQSIPFSTRLSNPPGNVREAVLNFIEE